MNFTFFALFFILSLCFKAQPINFQNSDFQKFTTAIKPLLSNSSFTEIVTLGSLCLPKFRVRSFLTGNQQVNLRNGNYLFDWMFILNYTRLAIALRNNLTGVFDKESLVVRAGMLHNPKYAFLFNHVYDHIKGFKLTPQTFMETYDSIIDKYVYLTQQSLYSFRMPQKTLYISYVYNRHSQSDFVNLLNSIKSQRVNNDFLLLILVTKGLKETYDFDTLIDGNLCFHEIDNYPYPVWHSEKSKSQWNRILSLFLSTEIV